MHRHSETAIAHETTQKYDQLPENNFKRTPCRLFQPARFFQARLGKQPQKDRAQFFIQNHPFGHARRAFIRRKTDCGPSHSDAQQSRKH